MKMKFLIADCRLPIADCPASGGAAFFNRQSPIVNRKSREGVALVITLILLSVTLVMAVAFLAISRRERNSVTTSTATATTRLATDSALAAAQAQIAASVLAANSAAYDYHLLVSTNYVDEFNSYFDTNTGALFAGSALEFAANSQLVLPRAPVFVSTNAGYPLDFRYYMDLNRNGHFEDSGLVPDVDNAGFTNGFFSAMGDPQWIGVLEHPDQFHGPNNRFLSRYAFFAQPLGNSLDLNHIHNQTLNTLLNSGQDGFFRNQGVGSWELNLAAFLTDLNTNQWDPTTAPYVYGSYRGNLNSGNAFFDAFTLLAWRYNYSYSSLAPISSVFANGAVALQNHPADVFPLGPFYDGSFFPSYVNNPSPNYWAGSDNTNRFYNLTSDLFDPAKSSAFFTNRLLNAGNTVAANGNPVTYDRYTLYRLLDQLGTDSEVNDDRMNLNYDNLDVSGNVVPGAETNCIPWTPLRFFTNAADRLLRYNTARWFSADPTNYLLTYFNYNPSFYIGRDGYGLTNFLSFGTTNEIPSFGLTNIPVYVNGRLYYSPAVNRLLQLAANIYDASTNAHGMSANGNGYPSVFRPAFYKYGGGDVYINGYEEATPADTGAPLKDVSFLPPNVRTVNNVYGIPWIIGAKKGFPSFNQFYMNSIVQVTRKLQVWRTDVTKPGAVGTNQMFVMSITNQLGCSFWNSYDTNYAGNLTVYVQDAADMALTNGANGGSIWSSSFYTNHTFTPTSWPRSGMTPSLHAKPEGQTPQAASFLPMQWTFDFLPESVYHASTATFYPVNSNPNPLWDVASPVPVFPQFGLMTTNYLQAYILDDGHVIDYVQLRGPINARNLSAELADSLTNPKQVAGILNGTAMWDTNGVGFGPPPPTKGVANQITVSRTGPAGTVINAWKKPPNMPNLSLGTTTLPQAEAAFFDGFFEYNNAYQVNGQTYYNTNLVVQAPYTPMRTVWDYTLWQANDPLVHYLASDLGTITKDTGLQWSDDLTLKKLPAIDLQSKGDRYQPWGRNNQMSQVAGLQNVNVDTDAYNLRIRDPLVWGSDYWDFPTYKYPTPGWLGRVHRGTPWQTVYLKANDVLSETANIANSGQQNVGVNTWAQWTGDTQKVNNRYYDAVNSGPASDAGLFDLFTTRLNDNAVKGALSVNQTHLAAWSAVLSGAVVLSNATKTPFSSVPPTNSTLIIQPAGPGGSSSPVGQILNSIYTTRTNFVNLDGVKGVFERVGDILRVPAFTEQSPFLNWNNTSQQQAGIGEEVYEWLPQQVMGLLRVDSTPRYVVYCYGQTLQPAPGGLVLSGPNFGLCTNYQITAESAARAIVRLDKHVTASGTNYTTTVENYTVLPP